MEENLWISVHTATYNRAYSLHKAYQSLKNQTCHDFEWVITDDGSTDNTEELVNSWIASEKEFVIRYFKRPHGGINRTLNFGFRQLKGKYQLMLDSDDFFEPDAIEKIIGWVKEIDAKSDFVGVGFAKQHPDGSYMKNQTPLIEKDGYVDCTNIERAKYKIDMDMSEAYKNEIFNKYEFQVWEGETYAPEQILFNKMATDGYKIRWRADKLTNCEYLTDGQTKRGDYLVAKNPMGFAMMCNSNLTFIEGFKNRFRNCTQMIALCIYAGHLSYLRKSNAKLFTVFCFPYGFLLSFRRRRQFTKLLNENK